MINLSTTVKKLHHCIRLNAPFSSDLEWWALFLSHWNSVSIISIPDRANPEATLESDAFNSGAYTSRGAWFQFRWPIAWAAIHITSKELLPIVMSCALWGHNWKGRTIKCVRDHAAVVSITSVMQGISEASLTSQRILSIGYFSVF